MSNETQEALSAKLNTKLSNIEMKIPYLKAEGDGKNGKSLQLNAIYAVIKKEMEANKVKLITEMLSYKMSETLKKSIVTEKEGVKSTNNQVISLVKAELIFKWIDLDNGYIEERSWFGSWSSYDNTGFAGGGMLTYFKRQFLMHEFNIESDEMELEAYDDKTTSPGDRAKKLTARLATVKNQCILDLEKATNQEEVDFAYNQIDESQRTDEDISQAYVNSINTIYTNAIKTATKLGTLTAVKKQLKSIEYFNDEYSKLIIAKEKELKKKDA